MAAEPNERLASEGAPRAGTARAGRRPVPDSADGRRRVLTRLARLAFAWVGIASAVACSSDIQKLAKELEPAQSWAATLQLAGESWLGNRVPSAYLRNTAGEARKQLQKSASSITQLRDVPPELRERALGTLTRAAAGADSMDGAARRLDTLQLRGRIAEMGVLAQALDSLVKQAKGSGS